MKNSLNFKDFQGALSHLAFNSSASLGRRFKNDEELSLYGSSHDPFQLDIEKIRLGKLYKRLFNKTQVFSSNINTNVRNRQTHTNEVVSIVSFLASILGLNQNLAEAIAYGHDIGHTPFGHLGGRVIAKISGKNFSHAIMGTVAAQKIERKGNGLNLCYETLEGMLNHSLGGREMIIPNNISTEAQLAIPSDKIAYVTSDLNDAFRVGFLNKENAPMKLINYFGHTKRERIANLLFSLIKESCDEGCISFTRSKEAKIFSELRQWMYDNVYHKLDLGFERKNKEYAMQKLFDFFVKGDEFQRANPFLLLAFLTDNEVLNFYHKNNKRGFMNQGFSEIIYSLKNGGEKIDIFNLDLRKEDFQFY